MRFSFRRALIFLFATAFLAAAPAQAQDELGGALGSIGKKYATSYTKPVTDALGANMNAGLFRTAEFGETGLVPGIDVYVGVTAMGAFTSESADSFRLQENDEFTSGGNTFEVDYPDNTDLPTAFGDEDFSGKADILDKDTGRKVDEVSLPPGLLNTSIAPLAVPQVGVGTVFGTDVQFRYLPETQISDYGSVSLSGISVRHSLSQYIPLSPINVAVQGTWQSLSLSGSEGSVNSGEIVDASGWALNAHLSKDVPVLPVTLYGGVQYESFGVDVNYTFQTGVGTSTITYEQDAANKVRALAGVSLSLAVLRINVDYALSSTNTVSAGVGLTL
ncbi:MAG: DUF6588 family protein [Salinibacter sp.]